MKQLLEVNASIIGSSLRAWRGTMINRPVLRQPEQPIELFEFEADPHCRLLREALTEMDLDALIRPCPEGGARFRGTATAASPLQLPHLVDPNTGSALSGSAEIIAYLAQTYAAKPAQVRGLMRQLGVVSGALASAVRGGRGGKARRSRAPERPLELFSFESSPYSRLVREVLCELELPYLLRNTGKGRWTDLGPPALRDRLLQAPKGTGRNRKRLHARTGRVQVPYLIDPNTGTELFESADIVGYLEKRYAL